MAGRGYEGSGKAGLHQLPEWARRRAGDRLAILGALGTFSRQLAVKESLAVAQFVSAYNDGAITIDLDVRRRVPALTVPSLKRWRRQRRREGTAALAGRYANRLGAGIIDRTPELGDLVVAMLARYPHIATTRLLDSMRAKFPGRKLPSLATIRAFVRRWRRNNRALDVLIRNPDGFRSGFQLAVAKADEGLEINSRWEVDGTPSDILLVDGRRHHILGVIDVFTRRCKFLVSLSESATAASQLVRNAVLAWGIPATVVGDNGSGFVSAHFQRVLGDLGIQYVACPPYTPQGKPFIERAIGTLNHELLPMLPGYVGANVAERQQIRARRSFAARAGASRAVEFQISLPPQELQKRLDAYGLLFNSRPNAALGGKTPDQVAREHREEVRRIGDPRALDGLLGKAFWRVITKQGIALAGGRFVAPELASHVGERVMIFEDADLGRVACYTESSAGRAFLCFAEAWERLGADRSNVAVLARQAQSRWVREQRAELRRVKARIKPEAVADALFDLRARSLVATDETPSPEVVGDAVVETAALRAAGAAVRAMVPRSAKPHDPDLLARGAEALREFDSEQRPMSEVEEWEAEWRRYTALRASTSLAESDRAWMARYEQTPEFRAYRNFDEDGDVQQRAG